MKKAKVIRHFYLHRCKMWTTGVKCRLPKRNSVDCHNKTSEQQALMNVPQFHDYFITNNDLDHRRSVDLY